MKKSAPLHSRTVAGLKLVAAWLAFACPVFGQTSAEPIYGPYPDVWETQFVKVKIHFVDGDVPWTPDADLTSRAENILSYVNDVFLLYRIYFVAVQGDCPQADSIDACSGEVIYVVEQYATFQPPENLRCDFAIDIFDHGDEGEIAGQAFSSPSKYLRVQGSFNGISASQSPNLIQMLGFAMGLLPTSNYLGGAGTEYTDDGCTDGECPLPPPVMLPYCYCCEDGVCDTEVTPLFLDIASDCSACLNFPNLSPDEFRNYMSGAIGSQDILCKDRFTPGQVARMKKYLSSANLLAGVRILPSAKAGVLPGGVYANIVVEPGTTLTISSPVEMLPSATITVKKGAKLRVMSSVTGACGRLWQGIIVEGGIFQTQTPANQGFVIVGPTGSIEHAHWGILVQRVDDLGQPNGGTGGGIVWVYGGSFVNNMVGVKFGQYTALAEPNKSIFRVAKFVIDDDLRQDSVPPLLLDVGGITRLRLNDCEFRDERSACSPPAVGEPSSRALGVLANSAGLSAIGCRFEGLELGMLVNNLSDWLPFLVKDCHFSGCYTGILAEYSDAFSIQNNVFNIRRPTGCPDANGTAVGIKMAGNATVFTLEDNHFYSDDTSAAQIFHLGLECRGTGGGIDNVVFRNTFENLDIANRAFFNNGSATAGLRYLCNTNVNCQEDFYLGPASTIFPQQNDLNPADGSLWPAGNVFSGVEKSFNNFGPGTVQYFFFENDDEQNPELNQPGSPLVGVVPVAVSEANGNCAVPSPCTPPCNRSAEVAQMKQRFFQIKSRWANDRANNAVQRRKLNQLAHRILQHHTWQDEQPEVDSILTWLALAETYPADLRLARHHFFSGKMESFDRLWAQLPTKFDLDRAQLEDFEKNGKSYALLRPYITSAGGKPVLSEGALDSLRAFAAECSGAGLFARSVLAWAGAGRIACTDELEEPSILRRGDTAAATDEPFFEIFPNPASSHFSLQTIFPVQQVRLLDVTGREVRQWPAARTFAEQEKFELPLGLPPGIYFVSVQLEDGRVIGEKLFVE